MALFLSLILALCYCLAYCQSPNVCHGNDQLPTALQPLSSTLCSYPPLKFLWFNNLEKVHAWLLWLIIMHIINVRINVWQPIRCNARILGNMTSSVWNISTPVAVDINSPMGEWGKIRDSARTRLDLRLGSDLIGISGEELSWVPHTQGLIFAHQRVADTF